MTRDEWLQQIRPLDEVAVYAGSVPMNIAQVTSASRTMITIGKYTKKASFRRKDGKLCGNRPMGHLFRIEQP